MLRINICSIIISALVRVDTSQGNRKELLLIPNGKNEGNLARFLGPGMVKVNSNVGNVKGKHTIFEINCPNCTITFRSQE